MREKLVIWGAGSTALIVADMIRLRDQYEISGFLDSVNPERAQTKFCGASILGGEEQLDDLLQQGVNHVICAISVGRARLQLTERARAKGFQLAAAIHPQAVIASGVPIGAGTFIMAGAVVMPGSRLGENVMISTCASVDHECVIADGVWINFGAHLGGRVIVEQAAIVQLGALVAGRLRIGADSVVGAGSLVLHDIPNGVLAYGTPAKVIRKLPVDDH
jgi:sugar O-acyltransferase (sialic acid O-acetyltransferase NeuD family)